MLANIADKCQKSIILHPVVVVYELGAVRGIAFKIQKTRQLFLNALLIVSEALFAQQVAFLRLARRVANHAGCPAYQGNGFVSRQLQVFEHHNAD